MAGTFPAADGTFMVVLGDDNKAVYKAPVIGWTNVQGALCFPLVALPGLHIEHRTAIEHPSGHVTDPTHKLTFSTVDEWLAFIKKAKAPPGANRGITDSPEDRKEPDDRAAAMPDDDDGATTEMKEQQMADNAPHRLSEIHFGDKSYKSKSFWSMPSQNAVFEIEGGDNYPKDSRCIKVTRDEFAKLKKAGATKIDPTSGLVDGDDDTGSEDEDFDTGLV